MAELYRIQVSGDAQSLQGAESVFSILERLIPLKFVLDGHNQTEPAGTISLNGNTPINAAAVTSLSLPFSEEPAEKTKQIETAVEFSDDVNVPFPFRGRRIRAKIPGTVSGFSAGSHEKVLATTRQGPLWLVSEVDGVKHFRSALPLPYFSADECFYDVFNGNRFLEMLPLVEFTRKITGKTAYRNAPLRASFIIDDPNLHWPKYGFVAYKTILAHAQKENYHVSFATIPFDTWFTHAATADLFRANSRRLSLLIHGNNHAKKELALNYSEPMRKALLSQAIVRINRLERKANLDICRVMVPPHGACTEEMLAQLPQCGFESACISAGSLHAHNPHTPWTKTLGYFPSEIIRGCPVLPRWGLTGNIQNNMLLAAYLGQPMILRGHHQDLRNGPEVFDAYAQFINGLGEVCWSSMTHLSRMNYLWRVEGNACYVKPWGRNIILDVPDGVTELIIENASVSKDGIWQVMTAGGHSSKIRSGEHFPLTEEMGCKISIEQDALGQFTSDAMRFPPTNLALVLRRLLSEGRDRLLLS